VLVAVPSGQAGPVAGDDLTTRRGLHLPASAIDERFARGSGPGGQHRNVTSSAVEVVADLAALRGPGADRVRSVHGATLRARAEESRSQWRNRTIARARLADAIDDAAHVPAARRPTRPSRGARQRRLEAKRRASQVKRSRSWRPGDD
jgi:ribosome-associated protein